jgi:hypothetical protein
MIPHLWQERRTEIASDPDLRAAARREFERQKRGFQEDELGSLNIAPEEPDTCHADRDLQS